VDDPAQGLSLAPRGLRSGSDTDAQPLAFGALAVWVLSAVIYGVLISRGLSAESLLVWALPLVVDGAGRLRLALA
jgi:hypothetical protein